MASGDDPVEQFETWMKSSQGKSLLIKIGLCLLLIPLAIILGSVMKWLLLLAAGVAIVVIIGLPIYKNMTRKVRIEGMRKEEPDWVATVHVGDRIRTVKGHGLAWVYSPGGEAVTDPLVVYKLQQAMDKAAV